MAHHYWGASLSRRWQIFERGPVKGFFGLGYRDEVIGRTEYYAMGFASQLDRMVGEVIVRHWSKAGIKLPNHGQVFATLTIRLNSGFFGIGRESHHALDPSLNRERLPALNEFGSERTALP